MILSRPLFLRVGLIGTGNIGTACGLGILKNGHDLSVFDVKESNTQPLVSRGAKLASSAKTAVNNVDVLITALPAPPHVRAVMEEAGVLNALPKGASWIDHTTTEPKEAERLGAAAKAKGIDYLEAPLTGGLQLLQKGQMTTLVGGSGALLKRHTPLLQSYTETVIHVGEKIGSASSLKIITNMLCAANLVLTGEALILAKKCGVDLNAAFDGIRFSAGNSFVFETEAPLVFNRSFDPGFTIQLHCKDLGIGEELMNAHNIDLRLFRDSTAIYRDAMARFGPDVGSSSPVRLLEEDTETPLPLAGFEKWGYEINKAKSVEGMESIAVLHSLNQEEKS